ncbi:MAG: Ig domain-containing protein, partial [Lysinibacillus sp.]
VGDTTTLRATVTPTNATNQNVIWTSSDPTVATVDTAGVVYAVAPGTATITATTVDGSYSATYTLTSKEK